MSSVVAPPSAAVVPLWLRQLLPSLFSLLVVVAGFGVLVLFFIFVCLSRKLSG